MRTTTLMINIITSNSSFYDCITTQETTDKMQRKKKKQREKEKKKEKMRQHKKIRKKKKYCIFNFAFFCIF